MRVAILFTLIASSLAVQKSFEGYTVLRTQQLSVSQALSLQKLEVNSDYDFWQSARPSSSADIMATPDNLNKLKDFLTERNIHYSTMVEDVEELVRSQHNSSFTRSGVGKLDWNDYYSHDEINAFIDELASSNDFIETVSIGSTFEGRDMRVIQIKKAGSGAPNIWIEAGIHAREWIAPAMATYIINELVQQTDNNFIDSINFHILPQANPDGYEYSRSSNRLWRKTRSDTGSSLGCKGVDPNRNWAYHWGESGVSGNKCSDIYHGATPFSEVETRNMREYVQTLSPIPVLGHCLHSYSQLWLYPYGYAYDALPENHEEIKQLGEEAVDALYAVHGTVFDPINSADLYPAAGASDDWYKGVLGTRFAYTTELRDTGRHGFILPASQIIPSGEELWEAMKVVFSKMVEVSK